MRKITAYILIILFVCMNLSAIIMAEENIDFDNNLNQLKPAEMDSLENMDLDESDKAVEGQIGANFNNLGEIYNGDNLPPEKINEIMTNMKESNIGYIFNSEKTTDTSLSSPQPLAPLPSTPPENRKVNNNYGTDSQAQPSLAIGPTTGNIYITWLDDRDPYLTKVYFARSKDDGKSFDAFTYLNRFPNATLHRPTIAVDSSENIFIAWSDDRTGIAQFGLEDFNYDVWLNKSTDQGDSWLPGDVQVNSAIAYNQTNPSIAIDDNDVIYVAWEDAQWSKAMGKPFDLCGIYVANSSNSGNSFYSRRKVYENIGVNADAQNPAIAVDENNFVWIVWSDNRTSASDLDVFFSRTGQPWTGGVAPTFNASSLAHGAQDSTNQINPDIAVINEKKAYVVWQDERSGLSSDIYFAKYSPSASSFANEYRLNNDAGDKAQQKYPKITVNSNNNHVYVNWLDERYGYYQNYFAKSVNNGGSFVLQKAIDDEFSNLKRGVLTTLAPNPAKSIAVHTNNTIYVVYAEDKYGNYDLFFQKSADLGNSWSDSIMVNDNDTESYQGISNKYEIAIGPDRAIHVVWAESREDFGKLPYETGDIYYAKSYNSGLTFTPGIRVNNKGVGAMKNPAIAVNVSNWVFITWTDASPGSDNINFAWSSNGGQTFEPVGPTDRQVSSSSTINNDYSDIAVNSVGRVFVSYIGEPKSDPVDSIEDNDTWVTFADYSGLPAFDFSGNDVKLNDDNTLTTVDQFSPSIAINPFYNYIYVVWQDARNLTFPDTMEIYFANSTDNGLSYSANKRVDLTSGPGSDNVKPAIAVNASGNISIVWQKERSTHNDIRYAKSIDHGITFTARKWVNSVSSGNQESPTIAIDDKYIYVTWQDSQNGNWDIYMAKSENNGSTFKGDIRVDDDGSKFKQLNPSIAVLTNLTDNVFIVWSDRRNNIHRHATTYENNYDIYMARSMNNGLSFSKSNNIEIHQTEPDIEVDDNGIVYAVWTDYTFGYWGDITFSKSYSGGQYYNTTTIISDDSLNMGRGNVDMVVQNGVIYVVWEDPTGDPFNNEIIFSKSTDGGQSFSTPANITNGNNFLELKPALAIDKNNKLHIVWEDNRVGGAWNIFYANSSDGGSTWSLSTRVNPPMLANEYFDPDIAINYSSSNPEIYVVYENVSFTDPGDISFTMSGDGGLTFLSDNNVTDDGGAAAQFNPAIDVDSKGNAYIVWQDDRSAGDWDIFFSKTTTYGINFSLNIQVNISTGNEYNPEIRVDPSNDNNVMVIWESDVGTGPDFNYNIHNATSIDGGTTFLAANRVDDTSSEIQNQVKAKLAVDSQGSIHAIWGDYRPGNGEIYNAIIMDNTPPIANAGSNQITTQAGYGHFLAAGSKDNYGIESYTWTFNDGGPKEVYGYNTKYIFNTPGIYIIILTVTDYFGNTDTDTFTITVSDLTQPVLSNDQTTPPATTGDPFTFKIDVTDFQLRSVNPVFVEYQIGPTDTIKNVTMAAGAGNQFTKTITVLDVLTSIYYNFSAVDENLNWNRFTVGISNPIPISDNDEPEYNTNSTSVTATTGEPFTFTIICTDNIDVETSLVGYRYGSSGAFTESALTEGLTDTYTFTITRIDDTLTPLEYYFNFKDTSDNWNQSSNTVVTILDNDLPMFLQDNSDTEAYAGNDFGFSLKFTDNIDIDSAHVVYTFSSTRTRAIKTLTQSGTDWLATVTVPHMLGKLRYTFHFNDTSQNTNQTSETVIDIQDNTLPSSVSGSGNIDTTTGEGFNIFAKFEDNIGIDTVAVHYLKEGTTSWQSKPVTLGTDGNYTITNSGMEINTSTDDKNWKYYFFAEDDSDNNITYGTKATPYTITVTDNDPPIADAGADITADKGGTVNFVGTSSTDNIGVTNYKWTFMYDGSKETLSTATPSFKFDISGFYDVTLNVTDAAGNWDTDVVRVKIVSDVTKPDIELQSPSDGTKIPQTTVTLHWKTTHADANLVKYDIYVGITPTNLDKETTTAQGVTEYELTGLEDGQKYYWQVQPKLGDLDGDKSPVWSFTIDLGFEEIYDVDIVADTTTVIIVVGNSKEVTLTVTNNGNVDDVITLTLDKKNFPDSIVLSQETLVLTPGQSLDETLTINTLESTPISNFNIIITATSQSATEDVSDSVTIKITTIEKPAGEDVDEDNLPDAWEIQYFGSIDKYGAEDDPDADGYSNLEEYVRDTDPTKKDVAQTEDTDGDNLPDTWEIEHFGDIQTYGKNDDPDNDGTSNYNEYLDGTNPLDKKDKDGDKDGDDNTMVYAGVAVAVIVIIIVLLLLFMMMKKKKGGETTEQPPEQQQAQAPSVGPGAAPPGTGMGGGPGEIGGGPGVGPGPGPGVGPGTGPGVGPGMGGGPGQSPGSGLIQ